MHFFWRRAIYIWLVYLACLGLAVAGMMALTFKAIELDNANIQAFRQREEANKLANMSQEQSELSDLISSALWRMDSILTPLIAQESTRPFVVYQPYISNQKPVKMKGASIIPSPLLKEDIGPFIKVHFQVDQDNHWSSPQVPSDSEIRQASASGINVRQVDLYRTRLDELKSETTFDQLIAASSNDNMPMVGPGTIGQVANVLEPKIGNTVEFENRELLRLQKSQQLRDQQIDSQQQAVIPQFNDIPNGQAIPQIQAPAPNVQSEISQSSVLPQPNQGLRGQNEWLRRNAAYEGFASNLLEQQQYILNRDWNQTEADQLGIVRAIWVNSDLLLIRSVRGANGMIVQGCWLDWDALRKTLIVDVSDLLTAIDLVPISADEEVDPSRTLATLPVKLQIMSFSKSGDYLAKSRLMTFDPSVLWMSPIRISLLLAWICLITASAAIALLLHGVIKLSERRGAFVSAVTHELRTPLTTFRMYSEMLSDGMVKDEKQVKEYLGTLRVEADRLTHLVENVLAYSRLERGKPGGRRDSISVGDLIERAQGRLEERASQSDMKLVVEATTAIRDRTIYSDSAVIEQILFNLVENACKYAQVADDRRIILDFTEQPRGLQIKVSDFGPGIAPTETRNLFLPFGKSAQNAAETASGVGLGLALCRRLARALNGSLELVKEHDHAGAQFALLIPFGHPPKQ